MVAAQNRQGDEKKLIALAVRGRQQLEEMWSRERDERHRVKARRGAGWQEETPPAPGEQAP